MLDAQTATLLGQQSSQPGSAWGDPKKGDSNENLAYYLAMMASNPAAQNPFQAQSGGAETLGGLGLPGLTGQQAQSAGPDQIMGAIQTGLGGLKTGSQLYEVGSKLFNSINGTDWGGLADVGAGLTATNLASDLSSYAPNALDYADWWTWGW